MSAKVLPFPRSAGRLAFLAFCDAYGIVPDDGQVDTEAITSGVVMHWPDKEPPVQA